MNPKTMAVTAAPVARDPDPTPAVLGVVWPARVVRTVIHRDDKPGARGRSHDNGSARRGAEENSKQDDKRFFHTDLSLGG